MQLAVKPHQPAQMTAVALKAYARIVDDWGVSLKEAADMSESAWKRAKKPGFAGDLTEDQMLRLSAVVGIYKSLELYFSPGVAGSRSRGPTQARYLAAPAPWTQRSTVGCRKS